MAQVKIVKIQDLSPVEQSQYGYSKPDAQKQWLKTKCEHWDGKCDCKVLAYIENCEANTSAHSNSFYGAFVQAYNNHEDLMLSPDDVWMVICLHFSKYINANSEKMREMFVSHEGKKKLTVTTWNELGEDQWDEFFNLMIKEIEKSTKEGIVDTLKSNFTTTGRVESLLSIASVMDSFKKYFEYGRLIPCCGINNVHFMGTLGDWESLLDRTTKLEKYAVTPEWTNYIDGLKPILRQFIETYQEKVDVDFWNKVMNITQGRLGSGSTSYCSGWILNFFGLSGQVESYDIKSYSIDVPVELINEITKEKKNVNIVGGFGGVCKINGAYRPQLSMIVYHDGVVTKM